MNKKNFSPFPYYSLHNETPNGLPTTYYIETAMACNLACPECVIGVDKVNRKKGYMSYENFETISNKIKPYAKLVYLHVWGEPLLNKNICKMIDHVSSYAHAHISTNALMLNEKKAEDLVRSGLGTLIISIDGMTQTVYEKYRVGGDVKKCIDNIKLLQSLNKKFNNNIEVIGQFIVFRHNEQEVQNFLDFCNEINIKPVLKKPYIRFGSMVEPLNEDFHRERFEKDDLLQEISKCPHADGTMTITVSGELLLCSQDYNADFKLGNILDKDMTTEKIWKDYKYKTIRENIKSKKPPKICTDNCMIYTPK